MKISMLKLKNCLGVKEMELKLGEKITLIQGRGKQGKTSILESIEKTLYNTGDRQKFVYNGENKAETYLLLDDGMQISKSIGSDGKVKSVKIDKEGMSPKSPETFLKSLVGTAQLNPIEFITKTAKEQTEIILNILPIEVKKEDIDVWVGDVSFVNYDQHGLKVCKEIEDILFKKRTEINRDIEATKVDIENMKVKLPPMYKVDEWRNVSLSEKYDAIAEANKVNGNIERANAVIDGYEGKVAVMTADINKEIIELQTKIEALKEKANQQTEKETKVLNSAKEYVKKTKNIEIEPLEAELKEIEEMKSFVRIADEIESKKELLKEITEESKDLTSKIETMRKKPAELLEKTSMPIKGLTVENGEVLINGLPVKNLCGTERIELALEIAKATSKELKTILVNGIEALSKEDLDVLIEKCKEDEYQYVMTRVTDGNLTITNEEGEIIA